MQTISEQIEKVLREQGDDVRLILRAQPRSKREGIQAIIDTESGAALKVAVNAPPVDGEANLAIVRVMAKVLKIPKQQVQIVSGDTSKNKQLLIRNMSLADVSNKILLHLKPEST